MPAAKLDVRKEQKGLYNPPKDVIVLADVPPMTFFAIDGVGDPNTSQEFQDAINTLYPVSYGLKMDYKKHHPAQDYVVPPLEGLWWSDDIGSFSMDRKDEWLWTLLVRIPDHVPERPPPRPSSG
jgi:hypothetical protein